MAQKRKPKPQSRLNIASHFLKTDEMPLLDDTACTFVSWHLPQGVACKTNPYIITPVRLLLDHARQKLASKDIAIADQ